MYISIHNNYIKIKYRLIIYKTKNSDLYLRNAGGWSISCLK